MTITMPEIVVPMVDDQLIADLQAARDRVNEYGLAKQQFANHGEGFCTVGAVLRVTGQDAYDMCMSGNGSPRFVAAIGALAATLGVDANSVLTRNAALYRFNDSDATEKADALALFDTTIARLSA